eukprot:scaffold2907_cov112-Isochrysis_galbana.AAC.4
MPTQRAPLQPRLVCRAHGAAELFVNVAVCLQAHPLLPPPILYEARAVAQLVEQRAHRLLKDGTPAVLTTLFPIVNARQRVCACLASGPNRP